jgi:transcriptional regulator
MIKGKNHRQDPTLKELDGIKRLLILLLIKGGASQDEIEMALHTDQANVSRIFPARKVKRFEFRG